MRTAFTPAIRDPLVVPPFVDALVHYVGEPCPICDLGPEGPCSACNAKGVVTYSV